MSSSYDLLCEELIVEIFTRLPAKSLVRFRSVSKSFCAFISSPGFIRLHTLRSPNKVMALHLIITNHQGQGAPRSNLMYTLHSQGQLSSYDPLDIGITAVEYPFMTFSIVGSCNGILCIYEFGHSINLWNPSLRRKVTLHDRPRLSDRDGLRKNPIGFGFDPVVDDYKILMMGRLCKGDVAGTFVYAMKTDAWREIASPYNTPPYPYGMSDQCLFNGALHWVVKRYLTFDIASGDCYCNILTFDLSSEVFSTIELPEPSWETNQVAIISGSLAVISFKHDDDDCWIWVRRNASWSVAFKLNRHEFKGAQRVFQRTANDDLLFNPFLSGTAVQNPEAKTRSGFAGRLSCSWRVPVMIPCVETLGLLDMGGTSCHQEKNL